MPPPTDLKENIEAAIFDALEKLKRVRTALSEQIIGQKAVVQRLLLSLIAGQHLLLEGVPGLAKTRAVQALASCLSCEFKRIQFTPDLLPSDLTGSMILAVDRQGFTVSKGPLFANLLLADEINRAPAKVQSALLEAMQEQQVTIGGETLALPKPFLVVATQNPIEQEGTYRLSEAQIDRFGMKVMIPYPMIEDEEVILRTMSQKKISSSAPVMKGEELLEIQPLVHRIHVEDLIIRYILEITAATRFPRTDIPLTSSLTLGLSPRGALHLKATAQAVALLEGRSYVIPEDVQDVASDVIAHRLMLSYEAEAEGITAQQVVQEILQKIPPP